MSETKKEEKKKLADEDAARRIKQLEDQVETLRKQVANHKQEEDTLLSDMEVTGQAFEDMQEQNGRLVQQLREKDDANFKLMSERIKSNQIARLAREEKEMYLQQVATLTTQVMKRGFTRNGGYIRNSRHIFLASSLIRPCISGMCM